MHRLPLLAVAGLLLAAGCSSADELGSALARQATSSPAATVDAGDAGNPNAAAIDAYVRGLSPLDSPSASLLKGNVTKPTITGNVSCTTTDLTETRQYDKIVAYAANSDTLWPGALLQGSSVENGLFTPVTLGRAPLRVSVSLDNLLGAKSGVMDQPSLGAYRDLLGRLLAPGVSGSTPADIASDIQEADSQEELSLALGASYSWGGGIAGKVAASFSYSDKQIQSRKIVNFTQAYYTVDADAPAAPSAMFTPDVTVDAVRDKFAAGDPPVYVASVTYGRQVIFTVESTSSSEETTAALKVAFGGVGASIDAKTAQVLASSHITAFIVGGDGKGAASSIDSYDALRQFITDGGNYSRESPGAPIAYKLRYLKDNAPLLMSLTQSYKVTQCDKIGQALRVTLDHIRVISSDGDGSLEIYGAVTVTSQGKTTDLFRKSSSNYIPINDGQMFPIQGNVGQAQIAVSNTPGSAFTVDCDLWDENSFFSDDHVGTVHLSFPIEDGWHRVVQIPLTDSQKNVEVEIAIVPL